MALRGVRQIASARGGAPLVAFLVDAAADRPAASMCGIGDRAFGLAGSDDGKAWEVQQNSGGRRWVDVTPSAGGGFTPSTDATTDLGTSLLRFRDLWLSRRIAATGSLGVRLDAAGATDLSVTNPTGTGANVFADGTLRWANSNVSANYGQFSGGPFSAVRTFTFPDQSGTVPLLERASQTFTEVVTFALGPAVGDGYYLRFNSSGHELRLQAAALSGPGTITLPQATDTVTLCDLPQTVTAKTLARCKGSPLTVAQITALAAPSVSELAYASDGRKPGEGGGAGTGVWAFYDGSGWFSMCDGAALAA